MTEGFIQPTLDRDEAERVGQEVRAVVDQIASHQLRLASSYARLGGLLREVELKKHWIPLGYSKFTAYLEEIRNRIDRKRSQLYLVLSVAKALLPYMSEEQLEAVGISKACELRRLAKEGMNPASVSIDDVRITDWAADPKVTAAMLRVKVNEKLHVIEEPQGLWFNPIEGFYATPDERRELEDFWRYGRGYLMIPDETPEHEMKKQILFAAIRESIGTWSAEVANGR